MDTILAFSMFAVNWASVQLLFTSSLLIMEVWHHHDGTHESVGSRKCPSLEDVHLREAQDEDLKLGYLADVRWRKRQSEIKESPYDWV